MNNQIKQKFKEIIKTLNKFTSEVNHDNIRYSWTYNYCPKDGEYFKLYEINIDTGKTHLIHVPCRSL